MKAGIHSSEFWLTVLAVVAVVALVILDKYDMEILLVIGGLTGAYTGGRTLLKTTAQKYDSDDAG